MPRESIKTGANKGIKYEEKINQILKSKNLQLATTRSAGASDIPDGYFWYNGKEYPLEIKKKSADFAQIELQWEEDRGFTYSSQSKNDDFSRFLTNKTDFLKTINNNWSAIPKKFTKRDLSKEDRNWDLDHFKDIKKLIDISYIEQFYNLKNPSVYYMQIENSGFFYLGKDIAGLGVPKINGNPYLRARVKTRSATNNKWGFLVAIKMVGIKSSTHDLEELGNRKFPIPPGSHIKGVKKRLFDYSNNSKSV